MPAKRGGVITTAEAHLMMTDPSTMLACLQIEAGDRVDDARMRNPNQTDVARGLRKLSDQEWDEIRDIACAAGTDRSRGSDCMSAARQFGHVFVGQRGVRERLEVQPSVGDAYPLNGAPPRIDPLPVIVRAPNRR